MEPHFNTGQPFGAPLNAFAGAQGVNINDLNFTQAQNVHYNYTRPLDLAQILNPLPDASHTRNRRTSPPDSQCLAGTRHNVREQLDGWVNHGTIGGEPTTPTKGGPQLMKPICWMYGPFGCGKSAVAQTMAEEYARRRRLAASFFFFRGAGRRSTINNFATTLAYQIALNVPGARKFIEQAIARDPHVAHSSHSADSQLQDLVYLPLLRCMVEANLPSDDPYLIVVDGMDECEDKQEISCFIDHSIRFFSYQLHIPLRLFITSRVEEHIRTHIRDGAAVIHLFDLSSRSNRADVKYAMQTTFDNARKRDRALEALGLTWPAEREMSVLVKYCDGSFIFMSTIARFILWGSGDDDPRTPVDRLRLALKINPGIDSIYRDVLSRSRHLPHFITTISTVARLYKPLSISAIAALLGLSTYEVIRVLVTLQAILQVPGRDDEPVTFFHTSLRDFLTDEARSGEFHSTASHHTYLMHRCLDVLIGTEPTANSEACQYALEHFRMHHWPGPTIMEQGDPPYNPIDRGEWQRRSFQSRRGERRPIKFTVAFLGIPPSPSYTPSRWSNQFDATGNLISRKSLHVCSFSDIVEGLSTFEHKARRGQDFELTLRRGNGVDVVLRGVKVPALKAYTRPMCEITIEDRVSPH